ncbi:hypothetical protein BDZ94DRAFT_1312290 [Collybia nuda]|uniref:Uncharacterized protein n=1 Tax=Collybia nuda TaxID=64659 RepID=A0A9P6CG18_9AGAR|nr:hypothetical protein BDZ94DRAFT_1312290 [Collybia nuda]
MYISDKLFIMPLSNRYTVVTRRTKELYSAKWRRACSVVYPTDGGKVYPTVTSFVNGAQILGFLPNLNFAPLFITRGWAGYQHPNRPINPSILTIGVDLIWQGEIAVFGLGSTVPFLTSPGKKTLRNKAVILFVTRAQAAFAMGERPPTFIQHA